MLRGIQKYVLLAYQLKIPVVILLALISLTFELFIMLTPLS